VALVANEGFAQIRNGLKEHIEAGKLCPTDLGVYTFLHLYCDYSTGVYKGTALGIAYRMGDATHKSTINKSLARLKKIKFINFRAGNGKRGGYEILIDKFEPTFGELRGCRLNAWKSASNGRPLYEAGTVGARSRHGEGTVEARSGHGQGTVEERIPYIQTIQTVKREDEKTGREGPVPALPPVPVQHEQLKPTTTPSESLSQSSFNPLTFAGEISSSKSGDVYDSALVKKILLYHFKMKSDDFWTSRIISVVALARHIDTMHKQMNDDVGENWTLPAAKDKPVLDTTYPMNIVNLD
jgi:hypothetical protein